MGLSAPHQTTLDRFAKHRVAWDQNPALRALYEYWYGEVRAALGPVYPGRIVELGSGPGFARAFLPGIQMSDAVKAEWHDYELDATRRWPFDDGALDGVFMFDVLHHVVEPPVLFREAIRALRPGGRLVLMEPYVSPFSWPVYRFVHEEDIDTSVDPFAVQGASDKDPFAANQALPTLIFSRHAARFRRQFPELRLLSRKLYPGFSYLASGGFSHSSLLPWPAWRLLFAADRRLPRPLRRLVGFRMLVALERIAP